MYIYTIFISIGRFNKIPPFGLYLYEAFPACLSIILPGYFSRRERQQLWGWLSFIVSYDPHIQNLDTFLYKSYVNFNWISAWLAEINSSNWSQRCDIGVNFQIVIGLRTNFVSKCTQSVHLRRCLQSNIYHIWYLHIIS